MSDDISATKPLTPNHFLLGGVSSDGSVIEDSDSVSLLDIFREKQEKLKVFWDIWAKDYIRNLPCIVPQFEKRAFLKVGSIVIIREDNVPRLNWLLGRVIETYPGKDGKIRSVKLQTSKGMFVRPVQKLHKLEILDPPYEDSEPEEAQVTNKSKTQEVVLPKTKKVVVPKSQEQNLKILIESQLVDMEGRLNQWKDLGLINWLET